MKTTFTIIPTVLIISSLSLAANDQYRIGIKLITTPESTITLEKSQNMTHGELQMLYRDLSLHKETKFVTAPSIHTETNKISHVDIVSEDELEKLGKLFSGEYGQHFTFLIDDSKPTLQLMGAYKNNSFFITDNSNNIQQTSIKSDEILFDASFNVGESIVLVEGNTILAFTVTKL